MSADLDFTPLKFGKYKGVTPESISEEDPEYIVWMWEEGLRHCSEALYRDCKQEVEISSPGDTYNY